MPVLQSLRHLLFDTNSKWLHRAVDGRSLRTRQGWATRPALVELLEDRTLLTTYVVDAVTDDADDATGVSDGLISLREAIIAANTNSAFGDAPAGDLNGDIITFDTSVFGAGLAHTISMENGEYTITENVTVNGRGLGITLDAADASRIFRVNSSETVTIASLRTANGNSAGANGGAILIEGGGMTNLRALSIVDSDAGSGVGGGVYQNGGTLEVLRSTIYRNTAETGGGIVLVGTAQILLSTVSHNRAEGRDGGGIYVAPTSSVLVNGTLTAHNFAARSGGGMENNGGILYVDSAQTNDNSATINGGAIHVSGTARTTVDRGEVLRNSAGEEGGALWNSATGVMTVFCNTKVRENVASGDGADQGGGAIFNDGNAMRGGRLRLFNELQINENRADGVSGSGGAILSINGIVTIEDRSTIFGNVANRAGGGIEIVNGSVYIDDLQLERNVAGPAGSANPGNGGGLHVTGTAFVSISASIIDSNFAASEGGGLWNAGPGARMIIKTGTSLRNNSASGDAADQGGGGIFNNGGRLAISDGVRISDNRADGVSGSGGGILSVDGAVTIDDASLDGNTASRAGGGIEVVDGFVGLTDVMLGSMLPGNGNIAGLPGSANPGNGGGLHITGSARTIIEGGSVQYNHAASEGGGLWNQSGATMTINGVTVTGNTASGDQDHDGGGGIFNNGGRLDVRNSTIDSNSADTASGRGGGIFDLNGITTITNSTISGNTATGSGGGVENQGELYMANVTITANVADSDDNGMEPGGGLSNSGIARLKNTIVAGNLLGMAAPTPNDINGAVIASAFNLIGDASTAGGLVNGVNGNQVGIMGIGTRPIDTILDTTLADNGGPTFTHALVPGSFATDAGSNALAKDVNGVPLANDQRGTGFPRILGGLIDIGAVEMS